MALNLKAADLYADMEVRTKKLDQQLDAIRAKFARFKVPKVDLQLDSVFANQQLGDFERRLKRVQALGRVKLGGFSVGGAGGNWAARHAASAAAFGRQQFTAGASVGVGLPYVGSPQMAAGMAVGSGISAVVDGLRKAAETSIDLESKMAEVRRVAGLSADETARLKKELMEISTVQPGVGLDDLIKMAEIGGRMGIAGKDLKDFAGGLAMVKNSVSDMEAETLANNMSRVLNVFQLGPKYIKGFGSALTAMDNATTASASDILAITQGLSGTAAAIGLTLPQVVALSAALRDAGLSNAVASSSFSQIFRKMATESGKFAAAAGVDAKDFADAYRRGPMEALSLLMKGLADAGDSMDKQELLKDLGLQGVRASGAMLQLGSVFRRLGPMTAQANAEFTTLKSLMDADALKGATTAASLGKLGNAVTSLADQLASPLLPGIKELTDDLTEMAKAAELGAASLASVGTGKAAKWADGIINANNPMTGIVGAMGQIGGKMGLGKFNGFQRLDRLLFGAPAAPAGPGPAGKAPALPAPAGAPAGAAGGPGGGGGGGAGKPWGLGPLGQAMGDRLGAAAGIAGIAKDALGQLGSQLAKSLGEQARPSAAVGLTGTDFARVQQQQILDSSAKDTATNTGNAAKTLAEMLQLMQKAKNNVVNALL